MAADEIVESPSRHLTVVRGPVVPGQMPHQDTRPATPLNEAALLTNAKGEPNRVRRRRTTLGPVRICVGAGHACLARGERLIAITWRLDIPMPVDFFASAAVAAG